MKSVTTNITLIIILAIFFACEEPAPIQISTEEPDAGIDIINPNPSSIILTGYDSTGVVEENSTQLSLISISGIKNTVNNLTIYKGYGQAVFLDTTKPVFNSSNQLLGFNTLEFENVIFGNKVANTVPFKLKYIENGTRREKLIGVKHTVRYQPVLKPENLDFPYDQNIDIQFSKNQGNNGSLNLRVPEEITGHVEIRGERIRKNLRIILTWNKLQTNLVNDANDFSEEIIIGGVAKDSRDLIPLIRLDKFRENKFEIKNSLAEDINAAGDFEYIVFTFLRKIRRSNSNSRLGNIYFASQSIHNIWIKN